MYLSSTTLNVVNSDV